MEQKALFKQMIDYQKTTFDNSFKTMTALQEQGEKMVNMFMGQAPWLPEEGKKAISEWIKAYKQGREQFKEAVDKSFAKVQDYFDSQDAAE
jgi:polyhydroxyalkanoate synthesis regulator phasin